MLFRSLATDGETVALVARQEDDLRVLRSDDAVSWRPLAGLGR